MMPCQMLVTFLSDKPLTAGACFCDVIHEEALEEKHCPFHLKVNPGYATLRGTIYRYYTTTTMKRRFCGPILYALWYICVGFSHCLSHPNIIKFDERQCGWSVRSVSSVWSVWSVLLDCMC